MSGPTSPDDDAEAGAGTPDELAGADFPSQAYSAPESEHITIAPYVPADTDLYDYDSYRHEGADDGVGVAGPRPPRWPWVVGVTAIIAAIALVVLICGYLVLRYLPFGRRLYAIGSNPDAARVEGGDLILPARGVAALADNLFVGARGIV